MKNILMTLFLILSVPLLAQNPIGKWKMISHISEYEGEKFDSHKALLQSKPCVANIIYEINTDGTYRLNAKNSNCDQKYSKMQQSLYSEQVWTIDGKRITIGHKKTPNIGQTYVFTIKGNTMIWEGTDGQGKITYQKL
jgi:CRISPR/Cas system-associated endoribonuclease Cas2